MVVKVFFFKIPWNFKKGGQTLKKIKWGIIATGGIANKFAKQFHRVKNAEIIGVGSRKTFTARRFAQKHNIPQYYGSYQELVNDPDIDVVYIATPHSLHCDNAVMALKAGKAVLCEKPFCINKKEARLMVRTARARNLFLMEAMWTRFNPAFVKLRKLLKNSIIEEFISLKVDFSFSCPFDPVGRWYNPQLGGGALLDVGVYPIAFASMLFGKPSKIKSSVIKGITGVDEQNAIIFEYKNKKLAQITSSFRYDGDRMAFIAGTKGSILLHAAWHRALKMTINIKNKKEKVIEFPDDAFGLNYEVDHVNWCIQQGKTESDIMPLDESIQIMATMDEIRKQWNFKYPMEK